MTLEFKKQGQPRSRNPFILDRKNTMRKITKGRILRGREKGQNDGYEWWKGQCGTEIREAGKALRYDAREVKKQTHKAKLTFIFWGLNPCLYVWWWGHHWPLRDTFLELLLWNEVAADSGVGGLAVEVGWRVTVLEVWHEDCSQRESSAERRMGNRRRPSVFLHNI